MKALRLSLSLCVFLFSVSLLGQSFVTELNQKAVDLETLEEVTPSAYFRKLVEAHLHPTAEAFLNRFAEVTRIDPRNLTEQEVEQLSQFLDLPKVQTSQALLEQLVRRLRARPDRLDSHPLIDFRVIPSLQDLFFSRPRHDPGRTAMGIVPELFVLSPDICGESPNKQVATPVVKEAGLYIVTNPMVENVSPCFHRNSEKLAELMNLLLAEEQNIELNLVSKGKHDVGEIDSFSDLVAMLELSGYILEVFSTRVAVDFFGFSVKEGNQYRPLRLATWFQANLPASPSRILGEHSELNLVVHDGKNRLAQVKFYHGIPQHNQPDMVAYWRADHVQRPRWSCMKRTSLTTDIDDIKAWLNASKKVSEALSKVRADFELPLNAYGMTVCNDSLSLTCAAYSLEKNLSPPLNVGAFPSIRAQHQRPPSGAAVPTLAFTELLTQELGLEKNTLEKFYVSDPVLNADPSKMRQRVLDAFPEPERFHTSFPEFETLLNKIKSDKN